MPTLPLFEPGPLPPGITRRMYSPGGYETWRFQMFDTARQICLCVEFWRGWCFDPEYRRAYQRYLCRPTRTAPPTPDQYPLLSLTLVENKVSRIREFLPFAPADFRSGVNDTIAELEANRARITDRGVEVDLSANAISAHLVFTGERMPFTEVPAALVSDQKHFEFPVQSLCPVVGEISLSNCLQLNVSGHGISDYCFGTEPLGLHSSYWMRGCLLSESIPPTFSMTFEDAGGGCSGTVRRKGGATQLVHPVFRFEKKWLGRSLYPSAIDITPDLLLRNPRAIDENRHSRLLIYDAFVDSEQTQALLEIVRTS